MTDLSDGIKLGISLVFASTPLLEVLETLKRKYPRLIVVDSKRLQSYRSPACDGH